MIKKLSLDTKEAENWFAFSNLISSLLTIFIAVQGNNLSLRITMILLIIQTTIIGYLGVKGLPFLKKIQDNYLTEEKYKNKGYVIGFYDVAYAIMTMSGITIILLTVINM